MARKSERNFSLKTKDIIARRAGFICSNPGCHAPTSGAAGAYFDNVGDAAHINAAGDDGPRFDSSLSDEYLSSVENGIWLCKICHKKVDNKKNTKYTVDLLKKWKRDIEYTSEQALGRPQSKSVFDYNEIAVTESFNLENTALNDRSIDSVGFYGMSKAGLDLFKNLDGILFKRLIDSGDKYKSDLEIDNYIVDVFEWIIGNKSFPSKQIEKIYNQYDSSLLEGDLDVINKKRQAFIYFFKGNIKESNLIYEELFDRLDSIDEKWIRDDILIDGRNVVFKIENLKHKRIKNIFLDKIEKNGSEIQYPYIDRLEKDLLNITIENISKYKYKKKGTQFFGLGFDRVFNNIQKIIYMAILYGSYTQIHVLRREIARILILYADALDDEFLYKLGIKMYILSGEFDELRNIFDKVLIKYKSLESIDYIEEVLKLRKAFLCYNVGYFDCFIFKYYGRVLEENLYKLYERRILKILKTKRYALVNKAFRTIPSNIKRFINKSELYDLFIKQINNYTCRSEIQTVLHYVDYGEETLENRIKIRFIINEMLKNNDYITITNLLIDIKKIDKISDYDDILLSSNSDENILLKISNSEDYNVDNLELVIDKIMERNQKTIRNNVITNYNIEYYIASVFFDKDTDKLRKLIENKIFTLVELSISSRSIEIIEKVKLLRCLLYIHFFDDKYDENIKQLLSKLCIDSTDSAFSEHYSPEYLILYVNVFKYLFKKITLLELLNYFIDKITEEEFLFPEISLILDYMFLRVQFNEEEANLLYLIICFMLKSKDIDNRKSSIRLIRVLYKTKYFDIIYNKLLDMSSNSSYDEILAIVSLIREINDSNSDKIEKLKNNILNSPNYNIRYVCSKYLN